MAESNKKKYVLGCDIGNGYGYVSLLLNKDKDPVPLFPSKYKVSGGYSLAGVGMPTSAYVAPPNGEEIVVFKNGKSAESMYKSKPENMVRAIKTRFKEKSITLPGIKNPVNVCDVYSSITRDLITLAQEELKNLNINPVYDIVFTFPAAFSDNAALLNMMQNSIEKIKIGDNKINVLGRLPEPAAVALDYLHYMQHVAPEEYRILKENFTVLVYDLGHGTFDTAVVTAQSEGTSYKLHSKAGLPELGGKNFDDILYQELLNKLEEQYGYVPKNDIQRDCVREEAIKVKIELSTSDVAIASVINEDDYCEVEITRKRFEELTEHLLVQTLELVQEVLDESIASGIKINRVVLSGGASQMPMVENGLKELIEDEYPIVIHRPSESVSFGAARFASGISKEDRTTNYEKASSQTHEHNEIFEQLTDCSYGILMPSEEFLEGEVEFTIPSGMPRPAVSNKLEIVTASSKLVIKVYRSRGKTDSKTDSADNCDSILWFPFDVTPKSKYEVYITALENYGIEVKICSETGKSIVKTTSDILSDLI